MGRRRCAPCSAQLSVAKLSAAGMVKEIPGRQRNRVFVAEEILRTVEALEASPLARVQERQGSAFDVTVDAGSDTDRSK